MDSIFNRTNITMAHRNISALIVIVAFLTTSAEPIYDAILFEESNQWFTELIVNNEYIRMKIDFFSNKIEITNIGNEENSDIRFFTGFVSGVKTHHNSKINRFGLGPNSTLWDTFQFVELCFEKRHMFFYKTQYSLTHLKCSSKLSGITIHPDELSLTRLKSSIPVSLKLPKDFNAINGTIVSDDIFNISIKSFNPILSVIASKDTYVLHPAYYEEYGNYYLYIIWNIIIYILWKRWFDSILKHRDKVVIFEIFGGIVFLPLFILYVDNKTEPGYLVYATGIYVFPVMHMFVMILLNYFPTNLILIHAREIIYGTQIYYSIFTGGNSDQMSTIKIMLRTFCSISIIYIHVSETIKMVSKIVRTKKINRLFVFLPIYAQCYIFMIPFCIFSVQTTFQEFCVRVMGHRHYIGYWSVLIFISVFFIAWKRCIDLYDMNLLFNNKLH
jgi:hypothetical protein